MPDCRLEVKVHGRIGSLRWLLLLIVIALPVLIVITLPARVAVRALNADLLPLEQIGGTVWRGRAVWSAQPPLQLTWRWRAPLRWQWTLVGPDTDVSGRLDPAPGGLQLSDISGHLPVERLDLADWLPFTRPEGRLDVDLSSLTLRGREFTRAAGRMIWEDARLSGAVDEYLGRIELRLDEDHGVRAQVRSLDPVDVVVRGHLQLDGNAYAADIWLQARRPEVQRSLARMGEVQPDGQVRLQQEGWLF